MATVEILHPIWTLKLEGIPGSGAGPEEGAVLIQFACPSCKATCSVDDKYSGRKIKCPKCAARVLHVKGAEVRLLTPGTVPPPQAPAVAASSAAPLPSAPSPAPPVPGDATPEATAVVPHLVKEFVQQSESKQNLLVVGGLIALFVAVLTTLGIVFDKPILVVSPIAGGLSIAAVWLWMRTKKLQQKVLATTKDGSKPK